MKNIINYISSVKLELSKVIWPKRNDVVKLTIIIFLISGIVALYLGILDLSFTKIFEVILTS